MRTSTELAQGIADALAPIVGVRVDPFPTDLALPPCVVVERPTIEWATEQRTFTGCRWEWPLTVVAARSRDKTAHDELDRIVTAVEQHLGEDPTLGGVARWAHLSSAVPVTATVNGQEFPAYELNLSMIA